MHEMHRSSVYSSAQHSDIGWPLRNTPSDTSPYIPALAGMNSPSRTQWSGDAGRSRPRLYIVEDADEVFEEDSMVHDRLDGRERKKRRTIDSGSGMVYIGDDV